MTHATLALSIAVIIDFGPKILISKYKLEGRTNEIVTVKCPFRVVDKCRPQNVTIKDRLRQTEKNKHNLYNWNFLKILSQTKDEKSRVLLIFCLKISIKKFKF